MARKKTYKPVDNATLTPVPSDAELSRMRVKAALNGCDSFDKTFGACMAMADHFITVSKKPLTGAKLIQNMSELMRTALEAVVAESGGCDCPIDELTLTESQ